MENELVALTARLAPAIAYRGADCGISAVRIRPIDMLVGGRRMANTSPDCAAVAGKYNASLVIPSTRPGITAFLLVLYIVSMIFVLVMLLVLRIKWNSYERLRARCFVFLFVTTLGVLVFLQTGPLQDYLGKERIPCLLNLLMSNMVVPLLGGALIGRLLDFMNRTNYARAVMAVHLDTADDKVDSSSFKARLWCLRPAKTSNSPDLARPKRQDPDIQSSPHLASPRAHGVSKREFRFWKALASRPGRFFLMFLILLPFIITSVVPLATNPDDYLQGCTGCLLVGGALYVVIASAVAIIIFGLIASIRVRRFPDAFGIVRECRNSFIFGGTLGIVCFALDRFVPIRGDTFAWMIPETLGVVLMFVIHGPLQLYLAHQEQNASRHQSSTSSAQDDEEYEAVPKLALSPKSRRSETPNWEKEPSLEEVLDDPRGLAAFEKFLVSIWAVESLRFYLEAKDWTLNFHDMGYRTALSRAKRIVRVFVDINGPMAVNLNHEVVVKLMEILRHDDSFNYPLDQSFFMSAMREILVPPISINKCLPGLC